MSALRLCQLCLLMCIGIGIGAGCGSGDEELRDTEASQPQDTPPADSVNTVGAGFSGDASSLGDESQNPEDENTGTSESAAVANEADCDSSMCSSTNSPVGELPGCCLPGTEDTCGLDVGLLVSSASAKLCIEKEQPGVVDGSCADGAVRTDSFGNVAAAGCCRPDGLCGYLLDNPMGLLPLNLGCVDPADLGQDPSQECEAPGSYENMDTGEMDAPTFAEGDASCGDQTCSAVDTILGELAGCCTGEDGSACGVDTARLANFGARGICEPRDQPGRLDEGCQDGLLETPLADVPLPGCCRPDGLCGYMINNPGGLAELGLGCAEPATLGDPNLESCTP